MEGKFQAVASAWVVLAVLAFSSWARAQSGWYPLTSPVVLEFRDVDFTNALCGTVVGEQSTILRTTDGGQTWTPQTAPPGEWLFAVSFATDSVGLIGGTGGTILFTQNAGALWTVVQNGWFITYYGVYQLSPTAGIVAGVNTIFAPLVAFTTNAWQALTPVAFYLIDPGQVPNEGTLYDVQMLDGNIGVAVADVWDHHGAIVRTEDQGSTWSTVYWGSASLLGVDFPTQQVGYAVGVSGLRVKSTDGGQTWVELGNPLRINWCDVDFVGPDTGWIVGENAAIYHTEDGGLTWQEQHSGTGYLYGVDFVNGAVGYAAGENGMILKTTTGGHAENTAPTAFERLLPADSSIDPYEQWGLVRFAWSHSTDPDGGEITYLVHAFDDIHFIDQRCVTTDTSCELLIEYPTSHLDELSAIHWDVSATDGMDTIFASNGTGVFFVNMGAADEPPSMTPRNFELSNFPNPFNATTLISFSLPQAADMRLRVFDVTGREVFSRDLGTMNAGTHRVPFDAASLSSGVYIARLETSRASVSCKLVLLR
jgi:photosystem II stability/assembly factor-like uncharacterized protein